jgi:tetratricopeptide (TPR) repeat protein
MGLAACWDRRGELFPLWGYVLLSMIGVILFFVTARFRLPVAPVLILLGAFGVGEAVDAVRARAKRRMLVLGAALLVGISLVIPAPRSAANTVRNKAMEMVDLASTTAELGRPAQAVDLLEEAVRLRPDYAKAQYSLGLAYQAINKMDKAVAAYQSAVSLEPGYTSALNNLGRILLQMRRAEDALPYLARAAQSDPRHATSRFNLGGALQALGRSAEAAAAYEEGLAIDPGQVEFLIRASWLRATAPGARDCEKARRYGEEAVRLTRRTAHLALYTLAAAHASCGDFPSAVTTIEEAITLARARNDERAVRMMEQQRDAYRQGKGITIDPGQRQGQ